MHGAQQSGVLARPHVVAALRLDIATLVSLPNMVENAVPDPIYCLKGANTNHAQVSILFYQAQKWHMSMCDKVITLNPHYD